MSGGLTFTRRRSSWIGNEVWLSAPAFDWAPVDVILIHWPGGNGIPDGTDPDAVAAYLRAKQRYYRDVRGYNAGYNEAVDSAGTDWEIRGDTFRCAANAPAALNQRAYAVQVLTNLDGRMTDAQVAAVRRRVKAIREIRPKALLRGHRDGRALDSAATVTTCPGDAIYARLMAGEFGPPDPSGEPTPEPTPPPATDEEGAMIFVGRLDTNRNHVRRGVGAGPADWLRSNELHAAEPALKAGTLHWYDPITRERITGLNGIRVMSETDLDLYIGYPLAELPDRDEG